jgi:hypothetical protein
VGIFAIQRRSSVQARVINYNNLYGKLFYASNFENQSVRRLENIFFLCDVPAITAHPSAKSNSPVERFAFWTDPRRRAVKWQ